MFPHNILLNTPLLIKQWGGGGLFGMTVDNSKRPLLLPPSSNTVLHQLSKCSLTLPETNQALFNAPGSWKVIQIWNDYIMQHIFLYYFNLVTFTKMLT